MDGLLDPMPIFLTVEQVAQRWSNKFNIGANCNYVLDCYPELTFYEFTLAGKPIKYSRERAVQEHIEHLNEKLQGLSVLLELHSFQDKLPEYEKKNIKVRRDDLLLFETSFKVADLEKLQSITLGAEIESAVLDTVHSRLRSQQDDLEADRNSAGIDWNYWAGRSSITSEEAAKLAYLIEAKEGDSHKRRDPTEDLLRKVRDKAAWLDDHCKEWSLKSLVEVLGEDAPIRMREASSLDNKALQSVERDATGLESEPKAEVVGADNNSNPKPLTTKAVYEYLKPLVKDENKLKTLLFKNASKTNWLSECKLGDGYNLPMVIKEHSKKGLLKEEYQKRFSEDAIEKILSVN